MVRTQVGAGLMTLHGWHCVIEDGEIDVFDVRSRPFVPASVATHSGHGPYVEHLSEPLFNEIDMAYHPGTLP